MCGLITASLAVAETKISEGVVHLFTHLFFLLGMAIILGAVIVRRISVSHEVTHASLRGFTLSEVKDKLNIILERLDRINRREPPITLKELAQEINELLENPVFDIVESREMMIAAKGYGPYGAFMSDFATGERFISRSWSAGVDGYEKEAFDYIAKAIPFFNNARTTLDAMIE